MKASDIFEGRAVRHTNGSIGILAENSSWMNRDNEPSVKVKWLINDLGFIIPSSPEGKHHIDNLELIKELS